MRVRIVALLAVCLLLTGCESWMNGEYHSVRPHTEQGSREEQETTKVSNYSQMCEALEDMVSSAVESGTLSTEDYYGSNLETNMNMAVRHIKENFSIGAYAVEDISYEIGTSGGMSAVAVTITYNYNRSSIPKIKYVRDMDQAEALVATALDALETTLVMQIEEYETADFLQIVRDYGRDNPSKVMEVPQVMVNEFPNFGADRLVELQFTYQSSRETMQVMQKYVKPVFDSAALYISAEEQQSTKYALLFSFLMERNDYTVETSITPAYSLLRHGVGDSKAFATVYAAMCRRADLDCQVISGTKNGAPWTWNIICEDGIYYHVDLLGSHGSGKLRKLTDAQMTGYVWDYSAYPACGVAVETENDGT